MANVKDAVRYMVGHPTDGSVTTRPLGLEIFDAVSAPVRGAVHAMADDAVSVAVYDGIGKLDD